MDREDSDRSTSLPRTHVWFGTMEGASYLTVWVAELVKRPGGVNRFPGAESRMAPSNRTAFARKT